MSAENSILTRDTKKIEFLKRYRQAKLEQRMAERVGNGNDGDEDGQ